MKCPLNRCDGSGFIETIDENNEPVIKLCECKKDFISEEGMQRKLVQARIHEEFHKYTMEDYYSLPIDFSKNREHLDIIDKIVKEPSYFLNNFKVLWIWGTEPNSCHTSLAIIMAKELIKHGSSVRFSSFQSLIQSFTDFDNKDILKDYKNHDIYIIDDCCDVTKAFISTKSDFVKINLYEFFSSNLMSNKKFICTSNVPVKNIDTKFNDIKFLLQRYSYEMNIKGNISSYLEEKNKILKK
jgi:hypothetical protein